VARCWLIYAIAPEGMSAHDANDALNLYISDPARGIPVVHDHFTGTPHGGFVVLFTRDEQELGSLDDRGPLAGWTVERHALVFSLTPVGFDAQVAFTLENYGRTTLDALRAEEPEDPRYWWQRRERS
jgi:hypothetical protein